MEKVKSMFYLIVLCVSYSRMKYFYKTLFFLFYFSSLNLTAQQSHFIYFQTENKQQFFIKFDDKLFNSESLGYIIVPRLKDSTYKFVIGLSPNNKEQQFNFKISGKDVGFLINDFGGKGLQLLNLETLNILNPADALEKNVSQVPQQKEKDAFSTMLANVVNDSSILQKDMAKDTVATTSDDLALKTASQNITPKDVVISTPANKEELEKKNTIPHDSSNLKKELSDSANLNKALANKTFSDKSNDEIKKDNSLKVSSNDDVVFSTITRTLRKNNKNDIEMIYVDEHGSTKDTIRILMPVEKNKNQTEEPKEITTTNAVATNTNVSPEPLLKVSPDQDKKELPKTLQEKEIIKEEKKQPVFIKFPMINSDCKNFATDDDFLKLRKKMVSENNDESMIQIAKKTFKTRCFTTEQIKNLSVLFLKDEGKYKFFDAAYPFVSDTDLYPELEKQLSDNYYITRFRAMIHK